MSATTALADIAGEIRAEHDAAQAAARDAVAHAIRSGELLLEAKAALPHGAFGAWLAANITFSDRTAQGYMRLARECADPAKAQRVADLSLRSALAAIAAPRLLESHPVAGIIPDMTEAEFAGLVEFIQRHGLIQKIVLLEGTILDGRQRYRACLATGVEPRFRIHDGSDPLGFVISMNIRRKPFSTDQLAMIAAGLSRLLEATAS